jgi:hypothetical protein
VRVVKELEPVHVPDALHPRRRLVILQRDDRSFTFAEEYYYISKHAGEIIAEGWARLPPEGIYPTAALAETDGRAVFARRHCLTE